MFWKGEFSMAKGSIEKRGENSWRLRIDLGYNPDGSRNRVSKTITIEDKALLKTTRKLQEYLEGQLAEFKREIEAGEYIKPQKMTFAELVKLWREKYGENHLSPTVLDVYDRHLNNHIIPAIGHLIVSEIKPIHLVNFFDVLAKPGYRKDGKPGALSGTTRRYIYRIVNDIFQRAVEWGLVKANPIKAVKKPAVDTAEREIFVEDGLFQLFEALAEEPLLWRTLIELAATTGMRRGELLGIDINKHLIWEKINGEEILFIDIRDNVVKANGKAIIKNVKTKKSKRRIAVNREVVPLIRELANEVRKRKLLLGDKWKAGDRMLLFCQWDGAPIYPDTPTAWFKKFLRKHGLNSKVSIHGLRHTYATYLLYKGYSLKDIQELLGHSNIRITGELYTHYLNEMNVRAAEAFSGLKKKAK
jgi:integrase